MKTYRVSPKPPKPSDGSSDTVKLPRPIKKHSPKPEPTPKPKGKGLPGDQYKPDSKKPKGNRRRILDGINEMNNAEKKKARERSY